MKKKKNLRKTIGIFVGIKILELLGLAGAIFGIYWLGRLALYILGDSWKYNSTLGIWLYGFMTILLIFVIISIIWRIIKKNWEWAKEMAK